ncbi:hypothetical protein Taro_002580 [Colocasia esculenta]|uniref:Uncharacterized protein n=1 Tax=Colocasia esculenta TaxID=4460 RepID=A0A843TGV8_COLES|nr:hypothetical protein [Colocasia esculenta]
MSRSLRLAHQAMGYNAISNSKIIPAMSKGVLGEGRLLPLAQSRAAPIRPGTGSGSPVRTEQSCADSTPWSSLAEAICAMPLLSVASANQWSNDPT